MTGHPRLVASRALRLSGAKRNYLHQVAVGADPEQRDWKARHDWTRVPDRSSPLRSGAELLSGGPRSIAPEAGPLDPHIRHPAPAVDVEQAADVCGVASAGA